MPSWRVKDGPTGLRLGSVTDLGFESERLSWAELLLLRLRHVQVFVLYFPSRFDLECDTLVEDALRTFGKNTGAATSVNFWDTTDPELTRVLGLFELKVPPALVLARGLEAANKRKAPLNPSDIYCISITDSHVLCDRAQLAAAVNAAHEVVSHGDPKEITGFVRARAAGDFLAAVGRLSRSAAELLLKHGVTVGAPGGFSFRVGSG